MTSGTFGVFTLLSEAGLYEAVGSTLAPGAVGSFVTALGLGLLIPDPGSVWVVAGPALVAETEPVTSLVAAMYGAGLSNLWLGFLFLGVLSIGGFGWREFVRYAAVITVYVSTVVLSLVF